MQTAAIHDQDLLNLAEETVTATMRIEDPAIRARLHEIAEELRELALPVQD
jgi:hypothetical protein